MLDDQQFEKAVQDLIVDICAVMYRRGYESVCIGHLMRLVGVPESRAQAHDKEHFALNEEFRVMMEYRESQIKNSDKNPKNTPNATASGATLH
jgi:hypothetical protein